MNFRNCFVAAGWLMAAAAGLAQESPPPTPTPVPTEPPSAPSPTPAPGTAGGAVNPTFFNPAIAVIGNFLATAGHNPVDDQPSFQVKETEISFQAVVDPYAKADVFVSISNEGVELEEGYVTFLHLPYDLLVKAGKFKAQFGKINTLHAHVLPWADEPLPLANLLGSEEGWNDSGLSVARLIELPGDTFSELTGQVFRGDVEGLFAAPDRGKLAWLGQYRVYRDLGDDHNLEAGVSYGQGFNGTTADAKTSLQNAHLVYRWKPLQGRPYRSFILRSEFFRSFRQQEGPSQIATGYYVSGDYQLTRRWFVGGRYEWAGHGDDAARHDRGEAVTLTFWPSEFSQVRGEFRQRRYAGGITANEGILQLQYAIGAHGAHPF